VRWDWSTAGRSSSATPSTKVNQLIDFFLIFYLFYFFFLKPPLALLVVGRRERVDDSSVACL